MTDKVQKIREEVVRMHNLLPVVDGDNISVNYADRICTTLEMYIDSLQEEPVSDNLEEAAKHYLYSNILYDDVYVGNPTDKDCIEMFKAGANWQKKQDQDAVEIAKEELIDKFCEWVKKNVTYTHPRKGTEECVINLGKLKEAMRHE